MFDTNLFASPQLLLFGALTGLVFGFLLQRGGVTQHKVIVGQFLLRDFTVLKIILTAVIVGGVGIYAMTGMGMIEGLKVKAAHVLADVLGGVIFGSGMAVLGYCPGTGIAAIGQGSRDAIAGTLGMLFGAAAYAQAYPFMQEHVLGVGELGKVTLVGEFGGPAWIWLAALAVGAGLLFVWLERRERGTAHPAV
ncbi:MAG: YeeE/YedE family protein [Planctomycetes bacterium]|nr:YeeE/YedE family protein [Planctomycetota bacterium]MCB9902979.1 YeeE/YedE family protein [Planctomycetota bacterium]